MAGRSAIPCPEGPASPDGTVSLLLLLKLLLQLLMLLLLLLTLAWRLRNPDVLTTMDPPGAAIWSDISTVIKMINARV